MLFENKFLIVINRLALLLTNLGHATGELHSLVKRRRKVNILPNLPL